MASCGDPNGASKENFQKALQAYYDANPVCAVLPSEPPIELPATGPNRTRTQMDALARADLFAAETFDKPAPAMFGSGGTTPHIRYAPTPAGEQAIRTPAGREFFGPRLCYATRRIAGIDSYTEPGDLAGMKVSRVTYSYDLKDVAAWASDAAVRDAFPEIANALADPNGSATDALVLTNEGWRHERALR